MAGLDLDKTVDSLGVMKQGGPGNDEKSVNGINFTVYYINSGIVGLCC